eukprot:SAG31_NODE_3550_length_4134_cov_2.853532_3_plen_83_part_00
MAKSRDPQLCGAAEEAELAAFKAQMQQLQDLIAQQSTEGSHIELEAFLLDSELFEYPSNATSAYKAALTRKHDLIYNATEQL